MKNYYTEALFYRKEYEKLGKYLKYYVPITEVRYIDEPEVKPFPYFRRIFFIKDNNHLISCLIEIKDIYKYNNYFFVTITDNISSKIKDHKYFKYSLNDNINDILMKDFRIYGQKIIIVEYE